MDIIESKDSYLVRTELRRMKREDFTLEVKDGTLTGKEEVRRAGERLRITGPVRARETGAARNNRSRHE